MKQTHKLNHIGKRSLSALLALVLSFSLLESGVFAALSYDPAEEEPEETAAENAEEIPEETAGQEDAAPEEEEDAEPAEEEETEPAEENFSNEIVALEGVDPAGEEETDLFDDSTVADADPAGGEEPDEYGTSTYAAGDTGAFAVYCETDTSLTFYYGTVPAEGDTYNGKTVTEVYTGFDNTEEAYTSASSVPWNAIRSNVTSVTFDETFQNVQPKAMAYWFYNFANCTEISGLNYIDTSKVTSMCELFDQCYLVENLDVSEWNTSNVTNMSFMFRHCDALTNIDVSGFVTSNVTTMQQMFGYTSGLTELDLSNFDTSNVTAMNGMFRSSGIKVLDLSGFDTSNVTEMNAMFRTQYSNEVAAIETIYVDQDWTINQEAEDFNDTNMFYNCWNLVGGNGTTFNSEKIDSTMAHIDGGTSNPGYFTSNRAVTTDISGTIEWDDNNNQDGIRPQSVTVSLLDGNGQQVTDENGDPVSVTVSSDDNWTFSFSGVFKYDDEGKQIKYTISEDPVNNYKTDYDGYNIKNTLAYTFAVYSVDDGSFTFYYGTVPAEGDTYNGKIVTNVYTGFDTAEAYTSASSVPWDAIRSNVTTVTFDASFADVQPKAMAYWFYNFECCTEISGLNYIDTSKVTSMCELFDQCYLVENLDVSEWDTSEVTDMNYMFRHCDALTNIDVSGFVTSNVTTMTQMFGYTRALTELDLSNFDTSKVTAINGMFRSSGIKVLNLSGFDTSNVTEMNAMFRTQYSNEVAAIETIYVDKDWTINREAEDFNDTNMFYNCWNLVGGNGTSFDDGKIDSTMAHIDGGESNPGYFTSFEAATVDISGTIKWIDNDNQDGIRPESVTVSLLDGDGQQVTDENENPVIDTAGPEGEWTFSFPSVSKYDSNGKPIEYTVNTNAVTGYNVTVDGSAKDGFTITCTHDPVTENIQVTKAWNDASNQDGVRPESITLNLIADGETDEPYATVTLSAQGEDVTVSDNGNEWTYIFKGVPVMKNGNPVVYTLTETLTEKDSENYSYELSTATKEINDNGVTYDGYSFTVTNTHEPAKIDITGEIVWDDANDQDGMRPDYVTVQVYGQDKNNPVRSFEVEDPGDSEQGDNDDDNTWTWSATGLDKYYGGGNEIQYTVQEVLSDGLENIYDIDIEGFTITNTHEPETIDIFGAVIWEDENNQDGLRPASVTVRLLSGENVIATTTVAAGGENNGDWTFSFTDIDKYADGGKEVEYSVEEILSLNLEEIYTIEITGDMDDGFVITNMHTPETIEISGTITWDDASNQDGKRPDKVGVQLFGQDSEGGTLKTREFTVESDGTDVWTWSMEVSRYRDGGVEVQYTVIYAGVDLNVYTQKNDGLDTTYSYTPETCTIFGSKTWVDDNNQDNTRPGSITIELHANGTVVDSKEVTDADGWAWSFEDVPVYSGGHKITYLITEDEVDDYDTVYTFDEDGSYNVTNTLDEGETSVTVIKDWEDAEDQDGKRPESVTVVLLRDGQIAKDHDGNDAVITLTEEGHWIGAFTKIDKYDEAGARIEYTLQEVDVNAEGYESAISGDMEHGYTVTNTYSPEQIDITGTKIWNDAEDQDGLRPDSVTIRLYADGSQVSETAVTAGDNDDWTFTFTGLDKYAAGSEISYTVSEEPVKDYESAEITGSAEDGFTVTNTHTPETIDISGIKVWDDDDDRDGLRPGSITVTLLADGNEFETTSLRVVEGFWGWFNSIIAFFSGQEAVTPDDNGNWSFSFTDLPKYRDGGIEIEYTIVEDEVEGYDTSVSGNVAEGFTITNAHEIETVTVAGSKIWDDANDQDGKRPASVQINLLADKEAVLDEYGNAVTVTLNEDHKDEDGKWNFSFEDLPKYHDGGKEYTYSITEEQSEDLEEYTTSYDGYDVTNSYTPELLNGDGTFRVVLVWDDEADNDGIRPAEVNVTLTKDNTAVEGATLTLTADETDKDGNWTGTFENLPKCENGAEISYSVKEDYLSGYTYRIEVLEDDAGNTYVQLTNVHVSVKENIEVTKIWDDWNNQDGKRPSTISVRLLLNGSLYKTVTIGPEQEGTTVSKDGNQWSYTMKDIPVDKNGETVEYTVIEVDVDNYDDPYIETIRGDEVTDNGVTYQPYSFEVTNSHTPEQIEISGTKVWDDGNDQDGLRPHYVSLHLYADGVKVDDLDVTAADDLDGDGSWEWSFPAYDKYSGGRAIEYTVEEDPVEDYGTEITGSSADGFTVTNSHTPATTTISGSKTWEDDDNADEKRPDSITIELHANGQVVDSKQVTAADGWAWSFEDVPVYSGGQEITYLISEDEVDDYDTVYTFDEDGSYNVTNTLDEGETSVTVIKDWEDAENQDGKRPESVQVALMRGDEIAKDHDGNEAVITLTEEGHWIGTFTKIDENENGSRIEYTLQEVDTGAEGYTSVITGDMQHGFVVTNSYTPEKTSVTGAKTWDDANDQDGARPDHVTVHLLADGATVESQTVTAADNWTWTFTGLPKYANGTEIIYTIEEAYTADGYQAAVDGFNIINSHTPSRIDISGTKTWDDAENQDGIRPGSVTVGLYAGEDPVRDGNGEPMTAVVNEGNGWSYEFKGLDEYAGGEKIDYTVIEKTVDGYAASYQDYSIENQHTPEKLNGDGTLGVILRWDDENDQDGIRPASNTVTLTVNGVEDETKTVVLSDENTDGSGNWIGSFTDLDKYENGVEIKYSVSEGVMSGYTYTAELRYDTDRGIWYIEIINTHAAVTTDITMTKVWDDADNQDGKRPGEITVNLASNGSAVKSRTLTAETDGVTVSDDGNEWSFTFIDLPVDQNGEPIEYSLTEIDVGGYSHEVTTTAGEKVEKDGVTYTPYSFTVTNTHTPEKTAVSVEKIWDDENDQDGLRPENLTVCLFAGDDPVLDENGEPVTGQMVPDDDDNWTYTFENLDKYAAGEEIDYRVDEIQTDGYEEISLTGNRKDGFTITNRHVPETTDISGDKVWADDGDAAGYRPKSITVNLYANGLVADSQTVSAADGWSWTFEDVPVYSGGHKITYVTTETAIDDYTTTYQGFTLTNTLSPGETSVTVFKDWEDSEDQDGKRPASVRVALMNGDDVAVDHNGKEAVITLTEAGGWEGTFEEIDEFDANGARIQYTVREIAADLEDYDSEITGDMADGFVITNSYTPETTSVTGTKTWSDADDQDGIRPEKITIYLYADGQPIRSTTVTEEDDWTWTFEDLPKYRDGGVEIEYTFGEAVISGYDAAVSGPDVTNSHSPELLNGDGTFKVVLTWDDEANNDGIRPDEVNIKLTRNNTEAEGYALTLTADEIDENGNWVGTFTGLPRYENGEEISYSVKEDYLSGYTYRIEVKTDSDGNTYVQLTNVHVSVKEDIEVTKIWDDADDQDGIRPDSITVRLLLNNSLYKTVTLTEKTEGVTVGNNGNTWTYTMKDIPVDKNGETVEYTLIEVDVDNYDPDIETVRGEVTEDNGVTYQPYSFTVTNSHTPETTSVSGSVIWDDAGNQDGVRPGSVTLHILADGTEVAAATEVVSDGSDSWAWTYEGLPKYRDGGQEIYYTVILENEISGYETEIKDYNIYNSHTPETTTISGSKTWGDDGNAENTRPDSITIRLHANGTVVDSSTVTASDGWSWTFADLPVYQDGHEITYLITEDELDDYDAEYTFGADGSYNVTNTLDMGETSVTVMKDWEDAEDQDGVRPDSVTVTLMTGSEVAKDHDGNDAVMTLTGENHWIGTFTKIDEFDENGVKIRYTLQEVSTGADGYMSVITGDMGSGFVVTNTYEPETTQVDVAKTWDDADDQDGLRPDSVEVHLLADGEAVLSRPVTAEDNWTLSFADLDKYSGGKEITYTIEEVPVDGYETAYDGYNITNTHTPETIDISGSKTWNDADDQDGLRPENITIRLYADGTEVEQQTVEPQKAGLFTRIGAFFSSGTSVSAEDDWSWTFTGLPRYADGKEIVYTISEDAVDGYTTSVSGYNVINSHTPAAVDISGSKIWDDGDDQDGLRPFSVTVRLLADGTEVRSTAVTAANDWTFHFSGVDQYAGGKEIEYTVLEDVPEGYEADYDGFTVTNTHTPATVDISGSKTWDDGNDQDGLRPDSVTVRLLADGVEVQSTAVTAENDWAYSFEGAAQYDSGSEIKYTVQEDVPDGYEVSYDGFDITNTHTPATVTVTGSKIWDDADNQDGIRPKSITVRLHADGEVVQTLTVTAADGWSWRFADLPAYDSGHEISYTVTEDAVDDYSASYIGNTVLNSYTPGRTSLTVEKVWDDGDDQDGIRPKYVEVALLKNGEETGQTIALSAADNWEGTFEGLDEYESGDRISYSVAEVDTDGYTTQITGNQAEGYVITNSHTPATVDVTGSKTWDDADDQDGKRPDEITIRLHADGKVVDSLAVTAADDWAWSFTDLPAYDGGHEITYSITEDAVSGYSTSYSGYDVTNSYTPGQTSVTVEKIWNDADDQDGIRPDSVEVTLLKNGTATDETLTLSEENNWEGTFTGLDEYTDGILNAYTVTEDEPDGYTAGITGSAAEGFEITNTHTTATMNVTGSKTWDDADDQDGKRPESITIRLHADGRVVQTADVTAADGWAWSFTDLPKYANGNEITYTVTEDAVSDYSTSYSEYDVINSYTPGQTSLTVEKTWDDANDQDGIRPKYVEVALLKNGEETGETLTLSAENSWEGVFSGLDEYTEGRLNKYTVQESQAADGYTAVITGNASSGYEIINSHTPATINVAGCKTWDDADDQDGKRPEEITIRLLADGTEINSMTVAEKDDWSWTFADLPQYAGGTAISYTITEDAVDEYSAVYDGYNVTNTHTPGQTSLTVVKAWDDADDQDGIRPESVEVALLKNGTATGQTVTLSEQNGWEDTFTGLDEYTGGKQNIYTVDEISVFGYDTKITGDATAGYTITNTHTPATVSVSGSKTWDDNNDQDGKRPDEITVRLLADGSEAASITVTEKDNWSWTFADLPQYAGGTEITYTITEDAVDGYSTAYDGYNVINSHDTETINIPVAKIWEDDDNEYGHRPDSIDVALLADGGETGMTLTLTEDNDWSGDFEGLPKYAAGGEIEYTIRETDDDVLQYYTPQISGDAEIGFIIVNQREYFDIDEEIVVDEDDRDSWVKSEPVNENNAIQVEMSVPLPVIETEELGSGQYTMVFHEVLDSQVVLDDLDADIGVYLNSSGVSKLSSVNTLADASDREKVKHQYYTLNFDPDDGCSLHVDVDLTALYTDGVITEEDLLGGTEIMIFFYADLEGTGLNGSYRLTAWYQVYNGDQLQYTSAEDFVEVYTFEISVLKYDTSALTGDDYEGAALAGAKMGLYNDAACEDPVIRSDVPYTATSGEDGLAIFYGLTEGTYYVTELEAPEGYVCSDQVMEATVSRDMDGYICELRFANDPAAADVPRAPEKTVDAGDGTEVTTGQELTYTISYYNSGSETADVTITDTLEAGLDFVSATDGGTYDQETRTVTWTIADAPAYTEGSVELTAAVNGDADRADGVSNTAAVQIGSDAAADTNSVNNPLPSDEGTTGTPDDGNPDKGNPDDGNPDKGNPDNGNPGTGGTGGTGSNGGNTHSPQTDGPEPVLTMIALAAGVAAAAAGGAALSLRAYRRREYVGKRLKK